MLAAAVGGWCPSPGQARPPAVRPAGWDVVAGRWGVSGVARPGCSRCGLLRLAVLCGWRAGLMRHLEPGYPGSAACGHGPGLFICRCAVRCWVLVVAVGDVLRPVMAGAGGGALSDVDCWLAVVGNVGPPVGFLGRLPGLALVEIGCSGWQCSWGAEYGHRVAYGMAGCCWCPQVGSLGRQPAVAEVIGARGARQLWLPGLEPGILVSVVASCRAPVRVWAAEKVWAWAGGDWGLPVGIGV